MSRSYKKVPYCGDKKGKIKKRIANHKVRSWLKQHPDAILQKGDFKKLYETWDICDYYWITNWKEYWDSEIRTYYYFEYMFPYRNVKKYKNKFPNKKESYRQWYKYYKMK